MRSSASAKIHVESVQHNYGDLQAVGPVSFEVHEGEFVSFVGPSGSGKSTLLNILAGILNPTSGQVFISGQPLMSVRRGSIGYVFQQPALIPWRTTLANVLLPLELVGTRISINDREDATVLLDKFGLSEFESRFPKELSGGMKRRVGLSRSLITKPSILLLDEPFGELDEVLRREMISLVAEHTASAGVTSVMVTHSIDEAVLLSNRVITFSRRPGKIIHVESIEKDGLDFATFRTSSNYQRHFDEVLASLIGSNNEAL